MNYYKIMNTILCGCHISKNNVAKSKKTLLIHSIPIHIAALVFTLYKTYTDIL